MTIGYINYAALTEREKQQRRDAVDRYQKAHPEKVRSMSRAWARKQRLIVLRHYSQSDVPFCSCCKDEHLEFLAMDHINGGGLKHRRELNNGGDGSGLYRWLIRNKFPAGFRVLCHNCNLARGFYGVCPHERERENLCLADS